MICKNRLFAQIYTPIFMRLGNLGCQWGPNDKVARKKKKNYMRNRK